MPDGTASLLQLAALIQTDINVQVLSVEGALTGKREHIYQASAPSWPFLPRLA